MHLPSGVEAQGCWALGEGDTAVGGSVGSCDATALVAAAAAPGCAAAFALVAACTLLQLGGAA